jgi:hypothetical protein
MSEAIYLGPADPLEWLRGFVQDPPSAKLMADLQDLAERIGDLEPSAIELLRPDDTDPDCPAEFRVSNDGDGVPLSDLGRHSAAARWAIRQAVVQGWRRAREAVPSRSEHGKKMQTTQEKARALLGELRTLGPRDRAALQGGGLHGGSKTLPARPDLDGEGWLVTVLESLDNAAEAELQRLGKQLEADLQQARKQKSADWRPDRRAGASPGPLPTAAHDAVPIWLHFRRDRPPASTEDGPFDQFVGFLEEMATGRRERYVRRDVQEALRDYGTAIARTYG